MAIKRYKLQHNNGSSVDTIYLETDAKSVKLDNGESVEFILSSIQTSMSALSSKVTEATRSVATLTETVNSVSSSLTKAVSDIESLTSRVDTVSGTVDEVATMVDSLNGEVV